MQSSKRQISTLAESLLPPSHSWRDLQDMKKRVLEAMVPTIAEIERLRTIIDQMGKLGLELRHRIPSHPKMTCEDSLARTRGIGQQLIQLWNEGNPEV